jgi:hypothetical protein
MEALPPTPAHAPAPSVVPAEAAVGASPVVQVPAVEHLGESWLGALSRMASALAALPALAITRGGSARVLTAGHRGNA